MTFSEKIQRLRRENGLSQEQLAERLNVSRQAVSKWELGTLPDVDNLIKISRFFDCSLDYLLGDSQEPQSHPADTPQPAPASQAAPAAKGRLAAVLGLISAAAGILGLLTIFILNSVAPAVIYDPPQGDVRTIMDTGLSAFLKYHHITWLFVLCCALALLGALLLILSRKGSSRREK